MAREIKRSMSQKLRMDGRDYSRPGWYFLTLGADYHRPFFGRVEGGEMLPKGAGSLLLEHDVVGASYLLLHTKGDERTGCMFRIVSKGPKVYSKETLIGWKYPSEPSRPYYLIYKVSDLEGGNPLGAYEWNLSEIPGWKSGYASMAPFAVKLTDLMSAAVLKTDGRIL